MIKIHESEMAQSSPEWLNWRKSGIGGSEIAAVMGNSIYQTAYQLWQIKSGLKEAPDLSNNFAVKRGHALEGPARYIVNETLGRDFQPCLFQGNLRHFIYSSDGHDEKTNELLEIKALGNKNHQLVLDTQKPLPYYYDQLQWGMLIAKSDLIHFVSYNQEYPEPIVRIEVRADKKYQDNLVEMANRFWDMVQRKIQPELCDTDFEDVSCNSFYLLKVKYEEALAKFKDADNHLSEVKAQIHKFADGRNIAANGLRVFISSRRGSVDYASVPELQGVDLDQYRKPDTKISYIK